MRGLACVLMFQTHCYDSWLGGAARDTSFIRWSQLGGSEDAWRGEEQLEREEQRRDPECDKKRAAVEAETNAFDRRGCHHECPHDEGRRETHLPGFGGSCHA